jgi:hypothetical protein
MPILRFPEDAVSPSRLRDNTIPTQSAQAGIEETPHRNLFAMRALGAAGLAAVFAASFILPPSGLGISTCVFRNTFGIPCPGCGLTRSFAAISHGQLAAALRSHPLGILIYGSMFIYMLKWATEALLRRRLFARLEEKASLPVLWTLVFGLVGVWLLRLATGSLY